MRQIIDHCLTWYPNEACGIIAGRDDQVLKLYLMKNAEPSPVSYFMDPTEQFKAMKEMRSESLTMLGIFHSHPQSPAYPSPRDVSLAFYDDVIYIIVGLVENKEPDVNGFEIVGGEIREAAVKVAG